jgi:hypothetical protein
MWKLALIHTFYPRGRRTAPQLPLQLIDGSWRSLSQDLHIPVVEVPGHSREPQAPGGPPDEPPIPHSLHQAMHKEPGPSHSVYAFRRLRDQTT